MTAQPPPLSERDTAILTAFLCGLSIPQIAQHKAASLTEILAAIPTLTPHLTAVAEFSDHLLRISSSTASRTAIATLAAVCESSPDLLERRRAACAILRCRGRRSGATNSDPSGPDPSDTDSAARSDDAALDATISRIAAAVRSDPQSSRRKSRQTQQPGPPDQPPRGTAAAAGSAPAPAPDLGSRLPGGVEPMPSKPTSPAARLLNACGQLPGLLNSS